MKYRKFSMCIDESTDISTTKLLSLVVRIAVNNKVVIKVYDGFIKTYNLIYMLYRSKTIFLNLLKF